jgi:hypothetical protein
MHETWWSTWGKPAAYLLLGILGIAGATVLALVIAGVLL